MKVGRLVLALMVGACGVVGAVGWAAAATRGSSAARGTAAGRLQWETAVASTAPASAPTIDKVLPTGQIALKTKGHSLEEAFDMLGKATGVIFVPEKRGEGPGSWEDQPNVWQNHTYKNVDFDLENVNYWQAAMRLADGAELDINGDIHMPTLQLQAVRRAASSGGKITRPPSLVQDMPALRVLLFKTWASGWARFDLDFLLDPRLAVLEAGPLQIQAATDAAGKQLEMQRMEAQFTPKDWTPRGVLGSGILSLSSGVQVRNIGWDPGPLELLRGYVPVVVATKTQSVEYALQNGVLSNMEAQRVGDWSLKVTSSQAQALRTGVSGPGPGPNHKFTLAIERLTDTAPPFPMATAAIAHVAQPGNSASISVATAPGGMTQEWSVALYSPVSKLILHVPTEVKTAVLPFEFKKVPLGRD